MFLAAIISLIIVLTNYLCFLVSKKESARAIFIDSLVDTIFPIISILSFLGKKIDYFVSLIQLIILSFSGSYILYSWFFSKKEKKLDYPNSALLFMCISFLLTLLCCFLVNIDIEKSPDNLSSKTTFIHFQMDFIAKSSFILCALLFKFKNTSFLINFLEGSNSLMIFYSTFSSMMPILESLNLKILP